MNSYIIFVPFFLIYFVGIGLSIATWRRHPQVSLLCTIAFLLFLGALGLDLVLVFWINNAGSQNSNQLKLVAGLFSMGRMALATIAWGLIFTAMFTNRRSD